MTTGYHVPVIGISPEGAARVLASDAIAVFAGFLHGAAYVYYLRLAVRGRTWPNPASWLMFAYGTALILLIESRAGASWRELLLPVVCATSSIFIAVAAWRKSGAATSLTPFDWWAFRADVALTLGYLAVWYAMQSGFIPAEYRFAANVVFLIGVNATTLTSFLPLLMSARRDPLTEHAGPWVMWSLAYLLLIVVTVLHASGPEGLLLLIYPAVNFILHTNVAALVLPSAKVRHDEPA